MSAGSGTLTTASTLSSLYSVYSNSSSYASDFNDITTGSSSLGRGGFGFGRGFGGFGFGGRFGGGFSSSVSATAGYDTLTGIGTPKGSALIGALSGTAVTATAATTSPTSAGNKVMRAKAAAVVAADSITSYVNLSRTAPAFVAGVVGRSIEIESTASVHSAIDAVGGSSVSSSGWLMALSGLLMEHDAHEAAIGAAVFRVSQTLSETSAQVTRVATQVAADVVALRRSVDGTAHDCRLKLDET